MKSSKPKLSLLQGQESGLAQWVSQAIGLHQLRVQVRLRGNHLHVLCEAPQSPPAATIVARLIRAFAKVNFSALLSPDQPPVYQVLLYGRVIGQKNAAWTELIHLNQLERYLEKLQVLDAPPETTVTTAATSDSTHGNRLPISEQPQSAPVTSSALIISNQSLARRGDLAAIARYLSETLSRLGVSVEVRVEIRRKSGSAEPAQPVDSQATSQQGERRLYIYCESSYSPEPALLSEPVAHQLRELKLEGFRDAVIFCQVKGEDNPDWALRIDLTPPEEMLKEWGRWGDGDAIAGLLTQTLEVCKVQVETTLKESTLHIVCTAIEAAGARSEPPPNKASDKALAQPSETLPDKSVIIALLAPLLDRLAPQNIKAAAVYGQLPGQTTPAWIEWLTLPAALHPPLATPVSTLAKQGDQPALVFLLSRLLNPDLTWRLSTGGIRVQVLQKQDLLHIMIDGPVCPYQNQVVPPISQLLRQLRPSKLKGVRIYGRRAGQKLPLWSHGDDFVARGRVVPQATPEFAASDAYVSDLLAQPDALIHRPELTPATLQTGMSHAVQTLTASIQRSLLRTHLVLPSDQLPGQARYTDGKGLLIWAVLGLVLTFTTDLFLGQVLAARAKLAKTAAASTLVTRPPALAPTGSPPGASTPSRPATVPLPNLSLQKSGKGNPTAFNSTGFTQSGTNSVAVTSNSSGNRSLLAQPLKPKVDTKELVARSPYPTFNAQQLDEKLALYYEYLLVSGPPDVLIIGSSRALRGIDPVTLQQALVAQGYAPLRIFNFGVNGATAQVVDLVIRRLLRPDQLPKLIVWADGARAFNSGRVDITYNAIAASEGYRRLNAGQVLVTSPQPTASPSPAPTPGATATANRYDFVDSWLDRTLTSLSATYAQREQLHLLVQETLEQWLPKPKITAEQAVLLQSYQVPTGSETGSPLAPTLYTVDEDGFLPLDLRFNPATYYQKYSKVAGSFDSDYEQFKLTGKQLEALDTLTQYTQAQEVSLVFVNLPLTADYLDSVRLVHEQEFRQVMLRQATEKGFVLRDWSQLWSHQANDYFSDPSHLNRYGAYQVALQLAQDARIPWPETQP